MKIRNLKYAAYEISKYLETLLWHTYPWYDHLNRRFELFIGYFGVRCETPLMLWISHAPDTWKNNNIAIQLMFGDTELLGCGTHPGEVLPDAFLSRMYNLLLDVRDNSWRYETYVKKTWVSEDLYGKCCRQSSALSCDE